MPVRSHGKLLAGTIALVSLGLAGCQTNSLRMDGATARTDPAEPPRAVLSFLDKLRPGGTGNEPVVSMMRPVPAGSTAAPVVVASNWAPVQRASSEELTTAGKPQVDATVQVGGPGPLPATAETPVPIEIAPAAAPVPNSDKPADKDDPTLLHAPTPIGATPIFSGPPLGHCSPPKEFSKQSLPPYIVEPPDILLIQSSQKILDQALSGQHLVRPDGYVSLGQYGEVYVSGYNLEQVRTAVTEQLRKRFPTFDPRTLDVDVIAFNSKVYYIITDGGGYGEQVYRIPVTGNETILDAMAQINGLPAVASKKGIWLARATPDGHPAVFPVDWRKVTMLGSGATNYQVFPGDRIYVGSDPWVKTDSWLAKRLAPVERLLGVTFLGSSTVNSIRNKNNNTTNGQ
jgi:polysaccharide biosynthesis/export protein